MNIRLLPDGRPGQHLGISHTLKHYLRPEEMWEDVAGDVAPALRPRAVLDRLPDTPRPCDAWGEASTALSSAWERLRAPYREGYGALLSAAATALPAPDQGGAWVRRGDRLATDAGSGVYLEVRRGRDGWQVHTAYRPFDFKLTHYDCPPRDPKSVEGRRRLAELGVRRKLVTLRRGGPFGTRGER